MRLIDPLCRVGIPLRLHRHVIHRANFELLPAFAPDVHLAAIHAHPLTLRVVAPRRRQNHAFGRHLVLALRLVLFEPLAFRLHLAPNAGGRAVAMGNARKDLLRFAIGHQRRQPDHLLHATRAVDRVA
jgi:hypothetical protein